MRFLAPLWFASLCALLASAVCQAEPLVLELQGATRCPGGNELLATGRLHLRGDSSRW